MVDAARAQGCAAVDKWQGTLLPKIVVGHRKRVESLSVFLNLLMRAKYIHVMPSVLEDSNIKGCTKSIVQPFIVGCSVYVAPLIRF